MRVEKISDAELLRRRVDFDDERLMELCYTLKEVKVLIEEWRKHYNTKRPDSALGYRPPAPAKHPAHRPKASYELTINLKQS
jgi:transposase InsO family protein